MTQKYSSAIVTYFVVTHAVADSQRRSFKHNPDPSTLTSSRGRQRSSDYLDYSCSAAAEDDACLAKNLLRSVSDDDDDVAATATGRLRPPCKVRDYRGCHCASPASAWRVAVLECPLCWAHLPGCDNCGDTTSSHRWSTPGIRLTTSTDSPTDTDLDH